MTFSSWLKVVVCAALLGAVGCGGSGGGGLASGGAGGEGGDDGGPCVLTVEDVQVMEGKVGPTSMDFTLTLSHKVSESVKVSYETEDSTASSTGSLNQGEQDYDSASSTLRFAPGEVTKTVSVTVNGDGIREEDERFRLRFSNATGCELAQSYATGTILNDDEPAPLPSISIDDVTLEEGNSGTTIAMLNVSLSAPTSASVAVDYRSTDGSALEGQDYNAVDATFTFPPGETTGVIAVAIKGDLTKEPDEDFTVTLSNPRFATLDVDVATVTITNDDVGGATLSIDDAAVSEGTLGTKNLTFTVSLSEAAEAAVTVDYATLDATAVSSGLAASGGMDYVASSTTLTFAPGETQKLINVTINGDALNEADETFTIELINAVGATVADPQGTGTIANDDTQPGISIADTTLTEGAAGTRFATFGVTLSQASGQVVTVNYATSDLTASSVSDYSYTSGKLTFQPGETYAYVSVLVYGDVLDEADETFRVNLSFAVNGFLNDSLGQATIYDDDDMPAFSISDGSVTEGNSGTKAMTFDITLSAASGRTTSISWITTDVTTSLNVDYVYTSGLVFFPAGTIKQTITVNVYGDVNDEANETLTVDLSNANQATIADGQAVGTIINDDSTLPSLNIEDAMVTEGDAGTVTLGFTVTLSAPSAQTVKVNYQTLDDMAVSPADFTTVSSSLSFPPGITSLPIDVTVKGDIVHELNETLYVSLSTPTFATIGDGVGLGTINDDDAEPTLSINDVQIVEGNSGKKNASFTISLSATSGLPVTVSYATKDGTAVEAGVLSSGQDDYDAASNVVVIAPGNLTSTPILVPINGDTVTEGNESFTVELSAPQNATINDGSGTCTITNDEMPPSITIADVAQLEGNAGTKIFTFTLTLSSPSGVPVTVDYATANGLALSGSDYTAASGTATFLAGQTTTTIDVTVIGETAPEGKKDEAFYVNLTNAMGATIADSQATGNILNDD